MTDRNKKFAGKRLLRLKNCEGIRKTNLAYEIHKIESVGHYAVRIYWKDNHNSGIYPFELLKRLDQDVQKD